MNYDWLKSEGSPKMLVELLKVMGTVETPGTKSNPIILGWAKEVGLQNAYTTDAIPWCGLLMALIAKRAGKVVPNNPLWAANWLHFGTPVKDAMLGDVLVFKRTGGNHVALYIGEDETAYHCGGGNQSDKVCITRILKSRLSGIRRPVYSIAQPANVRVIHLSSGGEVSTNEK